jgi:signal transduction histidine kinase
MVSDSGAGIRSERLAVIFDTFIQAEESTFTEYGGLGLGLAIAKATVEAHGGSIEATSAGPGRGSSFFFELPLASEPANS